MENSHLYILIPNSCLIPSVSDVLKCAAKRIYRLYTSFFFFVLIDKAQMQEGIVGVKFNTTI